MAQKYTISSIVKTALFHTMLFIFWLITLLPYRLVLGCGKVLGLIAYKFSKKLRFITNVNLEVCYPNMSISERNKLAHSSFISLGMGVMEIVFAWLAPNHKLPKLNKIHGLSNIQKAMDNKENIIMLGLHQVSAELTGRMFNLIHPFNAVYQKTSDKEMDALILSQRQKIYSKLIPNNKVRTMVNLLKNKEMLWFAPDQTPKKKHCVFVPFFDVNTASSTSTSTLAKLADATVIPVSCARTEDFSGYEITIHPKLVNLPSGSLTEDAIQINKVFEKIIRNNPEQYLWQYKRFKTTSDGSLHIYDQKMQS